MVSEPLVTAVMLVNGRHAMVARAVQSFLHQSYPADRRYLLIWDTGDPHYAPPFVYDPHGVEIWHRKAELTIGELRNAAIAEARGEVIVTFDSDDASNENRIAEQVSLLQSSHADLVGYCECLFWRDPPREAWLYTAPGPGPETVTLGASQAFWRRTWERKPFTHTNNGEDRAFASGLRVAAVSSLPDTPWHDLRPEYLAEMNTLKRYQPRLICGVHSGNSATRICGETVNWHRAEQWDSYCARVMSLEAACPK